MSHDHSHEHDHGSDHSGYHDADGHRQVPLRILAIDVGAGTQDVLVYESDRAPENCVKLILPSQTQVVGRRVRAATAERRPIHLTGTLMGGGASSDAIKRHLDAGLPVTATPEAARTIHNDLARVEALGVVLGDVALPGAVEVVLGDVQLDALRAALEPFEVDLPGVVAVAVQDHGDPLAGGGRSGQWSHSPTSTPATTVTSVHNAVRFEYLQSLVEEGGDLSGMVYREPPTGMTRMGAVLTSVPGAYVMDTGAAAVLGALGDPVVAAAARTEGAILVNVGNMHTFATLVKGNRLYGLFEHHTGGITADRIQELVGKLRTGTLDPTRFSHDFDGHGAALDPTYLSEGPFTFVAITGPNRAIARPLAYHEASPHGDMMLAGSFGLVEGVLQSLKASGHDTGLTLIAA